MFFIFIWLSRQPALLSPLQAPPSIFSALPTGRRPELVISVPRVAVPDKTRVIFISLINNQEAPSPGSPESQRRLEGPRILPVMLSWELSCVQNRKTQVFRIREKQEEMRGSVVRFLSLLFSSDTVLVIKKVASGDHPVTGEIDGQEPSLEWSNWICVCQEAASRLLTFC